LLVTATSYTVILFKIENTPTDKLLQNVGYVKLSTALHDVTGLPFLANDITKVTSVADFIKA